MIHFQKHAILHICDNNLHPDGKPIINIGDMIIFEEEPISSKSYIDYETFFKLIDMYFEYTEHGTREIRMIRVTGLLTKYQQDL